MTTGRLSEKLLLLFLRKTERFKILKKYIKSLLIDLIYWKLLSDFFTNEKQTKC